MRGLSICHICSPPLCSLEQSASMHFSSAPRLPTEESMPSIFDHVVCAFVASYGHAVTRQHAFPFFRTDDDVEARTIGKTKGIPEESEPYKLILTLQRNKELAILTTLDDAYKHRNLALI